MAELRLRLISWSVLAMNVLMPGNTYAMYYAISKLHIDSALASTRVAASAVSKAALREHIAQPCSYTRTGLIGAQASLAANTDSGKVGLMQPSLLQAKDTKQKGANLSTCTKQLLDQSSECR